MEVVRLSNGDLEVAIATLGAELQSIVDGEGREWLWQGDPAFWTGRAPILFPIVGRAGNDTLKIDRRDYPMAQHGFARRRTFEVVVSEATRTVLRLVDSDETRAIYPFAFEFEMSFELDGNELLQTGTIRNTGTVELPASFGYHPAFVWPLPGTGAKQTDHAVVFEKEESADIRRLAGGRVGANGLPTPVKGRTLWLDPSLFAADAIIFDDLESRSLWFGVPGKPGLRAAFPDMPFLGLWMKPGAAYLCIEPWQGHAAPEGFDGEMRDMPGMMRIAPGETQSRHMSVEIGAREE